MSLYFNLKCDITRTLCERKRKKLLIVINIHITKICDFISEKKKKNHMTEM